MGAKLTWVRPVMVNFICQFNWANRVPRHLNKQFWLCLWGCVWMRLTLEPVDWIMQIFLPNVDLSQPSIEGLNKTKWLRKKKTPPTWLHELGLMIFWPLDSDWYIRYSSVSNLPAYRLNLMQSVLLVLRPLNLYWNYIFTFLGFQLVDHWP